MQLETFEMERMQSTWENRVDYNLSESGVEPLRLDELVDVTSLAATRLGYPQTNGTVELREKISDLYPGSDTANVVVTQGTAEANFVSVLNLVAPDDEAVVMVPNYMQIWGLASSLGAVVKPFPLRETGSAPKRWAPDLDALAGSITDRTKLIAVCNPNNPTGSVLTEDEMRQICKLAGRVGAWILADEVYQGAERTSEETSPTMWGWYDRVLVTAGLSKAYGLPGLRLGWIVGPSEKIEELWSYKDYTSIAPGALSDRLARIALEPTQRHRILRRTRAILQERFPIVEDWAKRHGSRFDMIPPEAGAIAYLRYDLEVDSLELTTRLREEKSVLLVPGKHFRMGPYVRIGYGYERETLEKGLELFSELLETVHSGTTPRS